jgi:hypothetical protein
VTVKEDFVLQPGDAVISYRGHDKGKLMVIMSVNNDSVVVADGETRPICKHKIKKMLHIRYKCRICDELRNKIVEGTIEDHELRKELKRIKAEADCKGQ